MVIRKKRLYVYLRKINNHIQKLISGKQPILSEIQINTLLVVRSLIRKQDSNLLIAPQSGSRLVQYKDYYVEFNSNYITITNTNFSYYIDIDYETGLKLIHFFDKNTEYRRQQIIQKYNNKTINSLKTILNEKL